MKDHILRNMCSKIGKDTYKCGHFQRMIRFEVEAVRTRLVYLKKLCLGILWHFNVAKLGHRILKSFVSVGTTNQTVMENRSSCVL